MALNRETLWGKRAGVLFGQMYEDATVEKRAFPPGSRVFCIASAGCTAIALAAEHEVTAVDINPAQLEYARQRAQGMPARQGMAEHAMQFGRTLMSVAGWRRPMLERFLQITDCPTQLNFWHRELNRPMFRMLFDRAISTSAAMVRALAPNHAILPPRRFGPIMRMRLERALATHANKTNPYARRQFLGDLPPPLTRPAPPITWQHADAIGFLEQSPSGRFTAFSLSNIADGVTPEYFQQLLRAVRHAGTKDAMTVLRTFGEPTNATAAQAAAQDRAMIWGSLYIGDSGSVKL